MSVISYSTSALDAKTTLVIWSGIQEGDQLTGYPAFNQNLLSATYTVVVSGVSVPAPLLEKPLQRWLVSNTNNVSSVDCYRDGFMPVVDADAPGGQYWQYFNPGNPLPYVGTPPSPSVTANVFALFRAAY